MANFNELKEEAKKHINELILDDISGIKRLIGIHNGKEDYYWILLTRKEIELKSCVRGWIPLKGQLKDKDYNELERLWELNILYDKNKIKEELKILNRKTKLNNLDDENFYKF
jgi:hypothetical protein